MRCNGLEEIVRAWPPLQYTGGLKSFASLIAFSADQCSSGVSRRFAIDGYERCETSAALGRGLRTGYLRHALCSIGREVVVFFVCFFLPDLSMLGYLRGPKVGSYFYNWVHTYVTPAVLGLLSLRDWHVGLLTALVWGAHIGFDRMLGYGLKYPGGFHETHLGRIGKRDGIAAEPSAAR